VLVLRYWEDLSVEATAELLGMRENTVKSHTARGLAALRAEMAEELV
jgi:DNA-directed RNA polymerase specialized sigma24 family protein